MSAHKSARPIVAGQTKEACADNAAGATETSFRSEKVSHTNHPAPDDGAGEPTVVSGVLESAPTASDQPWPDAEALAALPEPALVAAINSGHKDIQSAAHTAKQHAANALTGALRTGALLVEVHRREEKAGWGAWIEKHCPELPISTAYRYMGLARKFPHVRMGQEITGLRQAYIAVGMMPEKSSGKEKKAPDLTSVPPPTGTDVVTRMKSTRDFLGAELERVNPAALDKAGRKALLAEINALIERLTEVRTSIFGAEQEAVDDALAANEKEAA